MRARLPRHACSFGLARTLSVDRSTAVGSTIERRQDKPFDAAITTNAACLRRVVFGQQTLAHARRTGELSLEGDEQVAAQLLQMFSTSAGREDIVTGRWGFRATGVRRCGPPRARVRSWPLWTAMHHCHQAQDAPRTVAEGDDHRKPGLRQHGDSTPGDGLRAKKRASPSDSRGCPSGTSAASATSSARRPQDRALARAAAAKSLSMEMLDGGRYLAEGDDRRGQ